MKHLPIIIILILALGLGFVGGVKFVQQQAGVDSARLGYLIENMKIARKTHWDIALDTERHNAWLKANVNHFEWCWIYDDVIAYLEKLR